MTQPVASLASGSLRLLGMSGKFALLLALAVYIPPGELGLYGLVVATISYGLYVVGLDFYTFSSRELLGLQRTEWGGLLRSEGALFAVNYVLGTALLLVLFAAGLLPWRIAAWCCLLLVVEHFAQELTRLFIVAGEQFFASVLLFVRQGAWCYLALGAMFLWGDARNLTLVLAAWSSAASVTCLIALRRLRRRPWGAWTGSVDWQWIMRGLRVAFPFLIATLALRALTTADRYLQEYFTDRETLGAYVLFIGVAGAVLAFLDGAVHAFVYPSLITAVNAEDSVTFRRLMRSLLARSVAVCVVLGGLILALTPPLLRWADRSTYLEHQALLPWLVAATCIHALGLVPHFGLYALRRDRQILASHVVAVALFFSVAFALSERSPVLAVPIALCSAFALIGVWKGTVLLTNPQGRPLRDQ